MTLHISNPRLIQRLQLIARREGRPPDEVLSDALQTYEAQHPALPAPASFLLAIAGLGNSGQSDVAERAEEILAAEITLQGWELPPDDGAA